MEGALRSEIIQWATPFEQTIMFNIAYMAMDLLDALDAKTSTMEQVRDEFEHLRLVEPLRERICMEAERVSHVGGDIREFEFSKIELERYRPTMNPTALALMEKQVSDLRQRAEKSSTHIMNIAAFERLKEFIGQLSVHGVNVLNVQDRFESWQRAYRRKSQNNGLSVYEKSFDKGYNGARMPL